MARSFDMGRRFDHSEPTFGDSDSLSPGEVAAPAQMPSPRTKTDEIAIGARPGRQVPRSKRRSSKLRFLLWPLALAAVGYGSFYGYQQYVASIVVLEEIDADVSGSSDKGFSAYSKPPSDYKDALNIAQLRWCLREELRINTLRDLVSTSGEINTVNNMHADFLSRCDTSSSEPELIVQAKEQMSGRQTGIIATTRAEQLLLLDAGNDGQWRRSELVTQIQKSLDALGYYVGSIDGLYGNQTRVAIRAFERDTGAEQTGQASYDLLETLRQKLRESGN